MYLAKPTSDLLPTGLNVHSILQLFACTACLIVGGWLLPMTIWMAFAAFAGSRKQCGGWCALAFTQGSLVLPLDRCEVSQVQRWRSDSAEIVRENGLSVEERESESSYTLVVMKVCIWLEVYISHHSPLGRITVQQVSAPSLHSERHLHKMECFVIMLHLIYFHLFQMWHEL